MNVITFLNFIFFVYVVVPFVANKLASTWKIFRALDIVYTRFWDKVRFGWGIFAFVYKQWVNDTIKRTGKNMYELSFMIKGKVAKLNIEHIVPEIVDIQNKETGESYIDELGPFINYRVNSWRPPAPCVVYYEDGKSSLCVPYTIVENEIKKSIMEQYSEYYDGVLHV